MRKMKWFCVFWWLFLSTVESTCYFFVIYVFDYVFVFFIFSLKSTLSVLHRIIMQVCSTNSDYQSLTQNAKLWTCGTIGMPNWPHVMVTTSYQLVKWCKISLVLHGTTRKNQKLEKCSQRSAHIPKCLSTEPKPGQQGRRIAVEHVFSSNGHKSSADAHSALVRQNSNRLCHWLWLWWQCVSKI